MKTLGIIPARGGSKGIPNKNKALFCGKPLITHTIKVALESNLDTVVVSSDDPDILAIATNMGIEAIQRPAELAEDTTPTLPVLQHALSSFDSSYDTVMTLQPTSPLRTAQHINDALTLFSQSPDADSLVSIVKVPHNMTPDSLMKRNGDLVSALNDTASTRRQEKPELWARNGAALYISKRSLLDTSILGSSILGFEMSMMDSIDIDTPEDFQLAELIFNKRKS